MADKITQSVKQVDVGYVANLARLNLTASETVNFQAQLDIIVNHFNQLRSLDVSDVEPMAHASEIQNVFRDDVVIPGLDRETVLKNAPEHSEDLIMVPTIVE